MAEFEPLLVPAVAPDDDTALMMLLDWLAARGLSLYPHQEEAMLELFAGRHVILATPTGSGKSLVGQAMHWRALCRGEKSIYTSPIKALVNEKFFDLCAAFGADQVGLQTGDATVHADAPIICCTAEVLAQQALGEGSTGQRLHVVMDEFHYYADRDRGMAWQVPLLRLENASFLMMSATLGDTTKIAQDLKQRTGVEVATVSSAHRPVPLQFQYLEIPLQDVVFTLVKEGKAPCYLVHFSHREASETAGSLMSVDLCSKEEKRAIADALSGERWPSPFGKSLQRLLRHGIGLHHAGLLPRYRRLVEKLAQQGLLKVICGTDTLGVGINVPLRTVLFSKLCKFDGEKSRLLQVREFQQIAGRAGRKGYDDKGWVVALAPEHVIANKRMEAKSGRDGKPVKFVRQKPPEKGYVPWDETTFQRLVAGQSEKLEPVFRVDAGLVCQVLRADPEHAGRGLARVADLIGRSHLHPGGQLQQRRELARIARSLRRTGILRLEPGNPPQCWMDADLQDDFSLHHTLSLFLVEALEHLDTRHQEQFGDDNPEGDALWAADVLSCCEAILENPMPVLLAQVNQEKSRLVAEMKADGVPYEERMEKLEGVSWPKPLADFLYAEADLFEARHPWLQGGSVRPKGIARQMFADFLSFDDLIRDLDLEPAEGVLLRYLSQAYKALMQNVPDRWRSPAVWEAIGYLRAVIGKTDASLVEEWESLRTGKPIEAQGIVLPTKKKSRKLIDLARDPKAFAARARAEMVQLLRLLLAGRFADAAEAIRQGEGNEAWPAERLQAAWAQVADQIGQPVWDHRAHLSEHCHARLVEPKIWGVTQTIFSDDGPSELQLHAEVDLRRDSEEEDGPLLWLMSIGES